MLRLLQPGLTAAFAVAHDAALLDCLSDLLQRGPLPALPARVAQLPLRLGGLGLRSAVTSAPAAYWASWADSLPVFQRQLPALLEVARLEAGVSPALCLQAAAAAVAGLSSPSWRPPTWRELLAGAEPAPLLEDSDGGWQRQATAVVEDNTQLDRSSSCLLVSQQGPFAGRLFNVLPQGQGLKTACRTPPRLSARLPFLPAAEEVPRLTRHPARRLSIPQLQARWQRGRCSDSLRRARKPAAARAFDAARRQLQAQLGTPQRRAVVVASCIRSLVSGQQHSQLAVAPRPRAEEKKQPCGLAPGRCRLSGAAWLFWGRRRGHAAFVRDHLRQQRVQHQQLLDRIPCVPDLQVAWSAPPGPCSAAMPDSSLPAVQMRVLPSCSTSMPACSCNTRSGWHTACISSR